MVRGIDKFREFFTGYEGGYVIIGGTAYEIHEEIYVQTPRATKDIDITLIVEALSPDFAAKFWEFIETAGYRQRNKGTGNGGCRHEYYKFKKPGNPDFPYQIELFSRNIGVVKFPDDAHVTPIPVDNDLSNLSIILMDDNYYNYVIKHNTLEGGIHIANTESLICLKYRTYLETTEWKSNREQVDNKHIVKHKKDVFQLVAMLTPADAYEVPGSLKQDVDRFCLAVKEEVPNSDFFKSTGLRSISGEQLLKQLEASFVTQQ